MKQDQAGALPGDRLGRPSLDSLFRPDSVALIGASESSRVGRAIVENLRHSGFRGAVYPVNPKYDRVLGLACYTSIREVPGPVDAALIATAAHRVMPLLEDCGRAGVGSVVVTADGFGELPGEGEVRQSEVRALAERYGMAVCGPNCIGIVNTANGASLYIAPLDRRVDAGHVSVVLQSGSVAMTLLNTDIGANFRYVVSSGNEAVLNAADYTEYLATDPGTRVIALVLESVRDPDRLLAGVRTAKAAGKTVVLLKLGISPKGRSLALSHTGALAGAAAVTSAVSRQFGIGQVADLQELLMACLLLDHRHPPAGNRVGCVTLSGGYAALLADLADRSNLALPGWAPETAALLQPLTPVDPPPNPLDAWGSGDFKNTMRTAIGSALEDPGTHLLIVGQDLPPEGSPHRIDVPTAVVEIATDLAGHAGKPIVVLGATAEPPAETLSAPLRAAGIPYLAGGTSATAAVSAWIGAGKPFPREADPRPVPSRDGPLDGAALREFGIPIVPELFAATAAEARAAGDAIGYPVVMKVASDDIAHKSDVGGVIIGVGRENAETAFKRLLADVAVAAPEALVRGVTLQALAPPGVEMIVGALQDSDWGWVVSCGLGGVYVEVLSDVVFRRVPVTYREAGSMLAELKAYPMLTGARGQEQGDIDAVCRLIESVSDLVQARSQVLSQVEFNPVVVHSEGRGVSVVDRLLVPAQSAATQ